ncbi:hypothetical protein DFP72DRAFT_1083240 [Ephemerocybe angulata]|uniref:Uncharacterized protein n=1 Tax=Ephemerocybe angulata TaxID=980116 RepID=A0A8H6LT42_9AGAR|nr:hypothetical protein DFP72DRAFT_1083240 [Tulosesus angulatus]
MAAPVFSAFEAAAPLRSHRTFSLMRSSYPFTPTPASTYTLIGIRPRSTGSIPTCVGLGKGMRKISEERLESETVREAWREFERRGGNEGGAVSSGGACARSSPLSSFSPTTDDPRYHLRYRCTIRSTPGLRPSPGPSSPVCHSVRGCFVASGRQSPVFKHLLFNDPSSPSNPRYPVDYTPSRARTIRLHSFSVASASAAVSSSVFSGTQGAKSDSGALLDKRGEGALGTSLEARQKDPKVQSVVRGLKGVLGDVPVVVERRHRREFEM